MQEAGAPQPDIPQETTSNSAPLQGCGVERPHDCVVWRCGVGTARTRCVRCRGPGRVGGAHACTPRQQHHCGCLLLHGWHGMGGHGGCKLLVPRGAGSAHSPPPSASSRHPASPPPLINNVLLPRRLLSLPLHIYAIYVLLNQSHAPAWCDPRVLVRCCRSYRQGGFKWDSGAPVRRRTTWRGSWCQGGTAWTAPTPRPR